MVFTKETAKSAGAKGGAKSKGKKSETTLARDEQLKQWREKAAQRAAWLLDKQTHLAAGQTFLYRIDKEKIGPKRYRALKPVLVTDESEISQYMEDLVEGKVNEDFEDEKDPGASYYFITAKEPSNQAIDSIMDRTFGRAKQGDLDVNVKLPQPIRPVPKATKKK